MLVTQLPEMSQYMKYVTGRRSEYQNRKRQLTKMTDYVPFSAEFFWDLRPPFDFMEQSGRREVQEFRKQIQTATMWHSQNNMLDAI
jgi:hypothetical protein